MASPWTTLSKSIVTHDEVDTRDSAENVVQSAREFLESARRPPARAHMVVYQHNGASPDVYGSAVSIDMLKQTLIPNPIVKGIVIAHQDEETDEWVKVEQLNYTTLKELRG